jgi:hypothetical protein
MVSKVVMKELALNRRKYSSFIGIGEKQSMSVEKLM